LEKSLEILN